MQSLREELRLLWYIWILICLQAFLFPNLSYSAHIPCLPLPPHPPLSLPMVCSVLAEAKYHSMHKWLESFVTKGLSFLSLLHKCLWSCHIHRLNHRAQTLRLLSCTEQGVHMHWSAVRATAGQKSMCVRMCVLACVCLCVCVCVCVRGMCVSGSKVLVQKG